MSITNDMAEMPVQLPRDPANAAEARSRYFNSGNAFNIKLPPVPGHIFTDEPAQALALKTTGFINCDQSDKLECAFPATTPLMLARYATVKAGEALDVTLNNTASIWYVITGRADLRVGDEKVVVRKGDVFVLPGGLVSTISASEASVFWAVGNDPQLAFDASEPMTDSKAAVSFVHYPADEIAHQLDVVYGSNANANTSGHALIFSAEKTEAARNITPTMTLSLNTLKPRSEQPPHKHNSAAITLVVNGDPAYSMVADRQCDWSPWATLVTPPAAKHSHHNNGDTRAEFLIVQDGGLYYHARTMGFEYY
ncbi:MULTISPECIES: cupin domain-containing protein [unclassified Chelatococcus]|uniref:cupin domain-containing protein n=1 Tax=unclassified Chelatococcus TaxID=2638111 RepID=UPI001BCD8BD0|nr:MULTISPECIES: cupin domain-containing protein [unclassified Chelatococcus]CAH1654190.1 Cupin domain-containing protein [Hyphomicrobiales bacterium]MBS7742814.1 cupin domain-containing protein [Chelatococcus sp. HY11]MBX3542068.1 cupin domain-containing protein [Chelatococcus sp.]MCO5074040.1 cupin domain-containing protein [Chelatococcus sp.]CAH1694808.1 Cupin domain-containing protein [Hyphomicrobiales bacterium]